MNEDVRNNNKVREYLDKVTDKNNHLRFIYNIYQYFIFKFYDFQSPNSIPKDLFDFLGQETLVTYQLSTPYDNPINLLELNRGKSTENINKYDTEKEKGNAIICTENSCIIIENANIKSLISEFENAKALIINTSTKIGQPRPKFDKIGQSRLVFDINTIKSIYIEFSSCFSKLIYENPFIEYTINPIITFLIYRNFCPSYYFYQPFVTFELSKEDLAMHYIKKYLSEFLNATDQCSIENSIQVLVTMIEKFFNEKFEKNVKKSIEFKRSDFIELYSYGTKRASDKIVFHIESFQLFHLEDFSDRDVYERFDDDIIEMECCTKFNHRCLTPNYGLVKNSQKITGILYKFMSNNIISMYLKEKNASPVFLFMMIARIFSGIQNVHLNDFKEFLRVKIDNNFNSYLSDFFNYDILNETVKYSIQNIIDYFFIYNYDEVLFNELKIISQKFCEIDPHQKFEINEINQILIEKVKDFSFFNENTIDTLQPFEFIQCFGETVHIIKEYPDEFENYFTFALEKLKEVLLWYKYKKCGYISIALKEIGDNYFSGLFAKQDFHKAKFYYELLLHTPVISYAELKLGEMYENGYGLEKDIPKAIEFYEKSSENSNSDAFVQLGFIFNNGNEYVNKDEQKAIQYFQNAAKMNNSSGFLQIGLIYKNVYQYFDLAKLCFEVSLEFGNQDAILQLAILYQNGEGVEADESKAKEYFELYVKHENEETQSYAIINIGDLFLIGENVKRDQDKAYECYIKSLEKGNQIALLKLGCYYEKKEKYTEAEDYYKKGSELGIPYCSLYLGNLYSNRENCEKDQNIIFQLYKKAEESNNIESYAKLGFMYENGLGYQKDIEMAKKYYKIAQENNDYSRSFELGRIYEKQRKFKKAHNCYLNYVEKLQNNVSANFKLAMLSGRLEIKGTKINILINYLTNTVQMNPNQTKEDILITYHSLCNIGICLLFTNNINLAYICFDKLDKKYIFGTFYKALYCYCYQDRSLAEEIFQELVNQYQFPLAIILLSIILIEKKDFDDSIETIKKASKLQDKFNHPINFISYDQNFELSFIYIFCYININIVCYYLNHEKSDNNKQIIREYFIRALSKLIKLNEFCFTVIVNSDEINFNYIWNFILCSPHFDLENTFHFSDIMQEFKREFAVYNETDKCEMFFDDPGEIIDLVYDNSNFKEEFKFEINKFSKYMHIILYASPYTIFFGKIIPEFCGGEKERSNIDIKTCEDLIYKIPILTQDEYLTA